jgi:hypothetical protein
MDLLSESVTNHIPPSMFYSSAYDEYLSQLYSDLIKDNYYLPRIILNDLDNQELGLNLMRMLDERFIQQIRNEMIRIKNNPVLAQRWYFRRLFEAKDLLYRKFMGMKIEGDYLTRIEWIKNIASDPTATVAPTDAIGDLSHYQKTTNEKHSIA